MGKEEMVLKEVYYGNWTVAIKNMIELNISFEALYLHRKEWNVEGYLLMILADYVNKELKNGL